MEATSIPTSTFKFLKTLKENNNRPWFNEHKPAFQGIHAQFKTLAETLRNRMTHHDEIENLKVYRIYRDTRFSKDKTPYKTYLSGSMVRATKWRRGGYYFHIEPGNSFLGGGFWGPNSDDLRRIRQEIAAEPQALRNILAEPGFQSYFGGMEGDQVKTAPRGYAKDHPAVDLLRYKQYLLIHRFTDKEVKSKDFVDLLNVGFKNMRPFLDYMSDVLTTDANGVPIED